MNAHDRVIVQFTAQQMSLADPGQSWSPAPRFLQPVPAQEDLHPQLTFIIPEVSSMVPSRSLQSCTVGLCVGDLVGDLEGLAVGLDVGGMGQSALLRRNAATRDAINKPRKTASV